MPTAAAAVDRRAPVRASALRAPLEPPRAPPLLLRLARAVLPEELLLLADVLERLGLQLVAGEGAVVALVLVALAVAVVLLRRGGHVRHLHRARPHRRPRPVPQHRQLRLLRRLVHALRALDLQEGVAALLHCAQVQQEVVLADAVAPLLRLDAAQLVEAPPHHGDEAVHLAHGGGELALVGVRLVLQVLHLGVQVRQHLLPLPLRRAVRACHRRVLRLQLRHRLLQPLQVLVELVGKVKEGEVLVLGIDEGRHELVHVRHARGRLDLRKGVVVHLHAVGDAEGGPTGGPGDSVHALLLLGLVELGVGQLLEVLQLLRQLRFLDLLRDPHLPLDQTVQLAHLHLKLNLLLV
mmetsp:Transcript_4227/g.8718  ORF Transcript_4227/g.8718 Transcript_4227/m.8718 type:complete len:351 (-) Transcript_4227:937-1989(-)